MRSRHASDDMTLGIVCSTKPSGVVINSMIVNEVNARDAVNPPASCPCCTASTKIMNVNGAESCLGIRTARISYHGRLYTAGVIPIELMTVMHLRKASEADSSVIRAA